MPDVQQTADRAVELLRQGLSCSEAVAAALAPELGVDVDICAGAACGFAGGLALQGHTCGVAVAGVMVLGLRHGPGAEADPVQRGRAMLHASMFLGDFARAHGSLDCCALCEGGALAPQDRARLLREVGTPAVYVRSAVEMLCELWGGQGEREKRSGG